MLKNKFFRNVSWLLIGNVFRMLFQFVVNIIIARYLGPEKQGIINYVATYSSFFISLVSLGINGVIIHELVNHKEEGEILGTAILLRVITAVISMQITRIRFFLKWHSYKLYNYPFPLSTQ